MTHRQHPLLMCVKFLVFITAIVFLMALGGNLLRALLRPINLFVIPFGFLIGYLIADFMTGTVHWLFDTVFSEKTPLIGRILVPPFRDHHVHPERITEYRLLEQDSSNSIVALLTLWVAWVSGGADPSAWVSVVVYAAIFGFCLGSIGTNLFHKWAHAVHVPMGIRWMQRHRLILSPHAHNLHHSDYRRGFCVTNGWMNGILDGLGFFSKFEVLIRWVTIRVARHSTPTNPLSDHD